RIYAAAAHTYGSFAQFSVLLMCKVKLGINLEYYGHTSELSEVRRRTHGRFSLLDQVNCGFSKKPSQTNKTVAPDQVDAFLAITADQNVTVYSGKVDLGTGVRTAMVQIAAEELDVDVARVAAIEGDTLLTPDQGLTSGSRSV